MIVKKQASDILYITLAIMSVLAKLNTLWYCRISLLTSCRLLLVLRINTKVQFICINGFPCNEDRYFEWFRA